MHVDLDISLDHTLGCGQAHRWIKKGNVWEGVLGEDVVLLKQTETGFDCEGCSDIKKLERYFRTDDDYEHIISEISEKDPIIADLTRKYSGLRLLRQDKWECLATYLLATNANVKRIGMMTESVCDTFGMNLGSRHSFPLPEDILDKKDEIPVCKLGFRESRFIELAEKVECGDIDIAYLSELSYSDLIRELRTIKGVGPKVADCVALFSFNCLNAFPIDVRIGKCMEDLYGLKGCYKDVSEQAIRRFGEYAGYAQEYLYLYQG